MKVVFDAYWWISGPPSLRHVLRELVRAWNVAYPHDELTLVVREAHRAEAARELGGIGVIRSTTLWPQALAATLAVGAVARTVEADLVITHNFACRVHSGVSAVYLHDVLFATNPEWFTLPERLYFSFMRRWIQRATVVFTSTMTEAARIDEHTAARGVVAVGLGLSTELTEGRLPADPDRALVSGRFMLTVGRLNARKNLGATIRGALRSRRVRPDHPLVIVGSAEGRRDRLDAATSTAIADGSVRFVGFVSEERLRWYYRNTALFLFLSLGEGFGCRRSRPPTSVRPCSPAISPSFTKRSEPSPATSIQQTRMRLPRRSRMLSTARRPAPLPPVWSWRATTGRSSCEPCVMRSRRVRGCCCERRPG